ncbi:MAG TPA: hypothetical protein VLR49_10710, partial [Ferruginibacter sp.]|nr:hypothetical protein [Ferruginibacter sp.]
MLFKKIIIPRFFAKNVYLLVIAAWLVTLSFLINNYWSSSSTLQTVQYNMNGYVQKAEKDFLDVLHDSSFKKLFNGYEVPEAQQEKLLAKNYFLFLCKKDSSASYDLQYWNTQHVLHDSGIIGSSLKAGFAQLPNGFYVWNKFDSAGLLSIALIPVKWNYIVTNDYLKNNFVDNSLTGQQYDIFPGEAQRGNVRSIHAVPLFYLLEKNTPLIVKDNIISIWLRVIAAILVLLFVHLSALYISVEKRFLYGLLFLTANIVFLRALSYFFPVPLNMRQLELFDPTIYGSSFILRSLGDLLINSLLFVWVVMFVRQQMQEKKIRLAFANPNAKWGLLVLGTVIILGATFTGVSIIRSLISDSKISFDVINFFSLNIYSVIGFVVLCCLAVGYYFLCQLVLYFIKPFFSKLFVELYLCTAILGLLLLSFNIGAMQDGLDLFCMAWLLLCLFLLNNTYLNLAAARIVSSKLVFWIFFFSVSMTILIIVENDRKELRNRKHYAEVMASKTDQASESMLNSMLLDFRLDFLSVNFSRLKNESANKIIKDSLINNNISGYTNRYNTSIYTFDENELSLFNDDNTSFNQLNSILNTQAKKTGVAGLYYYDESYDRFNYISKKEINDFTGKFIGTVFILV